MHKGFSLVELSIVLVILGLLTGGILAGQSLIRASELRAATSEYQRYAAATHTFRDKYFGLPGDFRDATRFWNRASTGSDCTSNHGLAAAGSPGACDGNGNGNILQPTAASESGEIFQFWRHLSLAGMVEGNYDGIAGSGSNWHAVIDRNVPRSKLSNTGWSIWYTAAASGDTSLFNGDYGNCLLLGGATTSGGTSGNIIKPEEAWNIDTKMDDGKPAIGKITVRHRPNCTLAADGSAITTGAADAAKLDATYNVASATSGCALVFRQIF